MHVPDGFLDVPTSVATGVVAVGAVGLALRKAAPEIKESGPALPGLVAAFVFATQMVNFPVGAGTSGHLMGGALAAALVGPWTAVLVMTVVLLIQGVLFADGGLTALGTNVWVLGAVTVLAGYLVMAALLRVLPKTRGSVVAASSIGALVSVPVAALVFTGLYAVGGTVDIPTGRVAAAMVGWHTLIGIGEALITGAVVSAVLTTRPDLVYVARHLRRDLQLVDAQGNSRTVAADEVGARPTTRVGRTPVLAFLAASLVVAGTVSYFASANPDGLETVAEKFGFTSQDHALVDSPTADYGIAGIDNAFLSGGLAGILGVLVTVLVGAGIAWVVRRGARRDDDRAPAGTHDDTPVGSR